MTWATATLTLAEVMVRAAGDDELLAALGEDLADLELEVLPLSGHDVEGLARLRTSTGLRMPDCCVVLAAQSVGGAVLTTDRALAGHARDLAIPVLPWGASPRAGLSRAPGPGPRPAGGTPGRGG
ncbi:PIN domain-containing protein [Ornithinimicrobium cavernae]|uniref:PIN domain-containing protein n=1 Tax=Ornithinimicrobium cavernae TaxID=2666047 RepID=UPI000D6976E4|nr:PIN domain-containing protein [Ornithinimicrobium cavernae]